MKGSVLAACQGPQDLHTKGSTHLGRGCALPRRLFCPGNSAPSSPFMLLWPVYPPKRGQSTGRSVNPAFEAGNAAIQGPGPVCDGLLAAALPTSAVVNPKCRTENFYFNRSLRLKSHWRSALRRYNRHHRNAKCSFSRLFLENY